MATLTLGTPTRSRPRSGVRGAVLLLAALALACGDDSAGSEVGTDSGTSGGESTGAEQTTGGSEDATGMTGSGSSTVATSSTGTTGEDTDATESDTEGADILEQLEAIEGMEVQEIDSPFESYRMFRLTFQQPADHDDPDGVWFGQRMVLTHRDVDDPMVLATSGYALLGPGFLAEPTQLVESNQLTVEQRFFADSIPEPADWGLLTIEQAASDHHRIVEALAPIYSAKWVSTGASKGGMTSVYHRRFFPDDVDATVAYVAPHNLAELDMRYGPFIDELGAPDCAQALKDFQADALGRRETLVPMLEQYLDEEGYTVEHIGLDKAFEFNVIESRFIFWQYGGAGGCSDIPSAQASDAEVFAFLNDISPFSSFSDFSIAYYGPYYFQAATQLGSPGLPEDHLGDLRMFPGEDTAAIYAPMGVEISWDGAAMPAVSDWLDAQGERIMFIYGGRDPWTATAFDYGGATDTHLYTVETGNHGAKMSALPDAEYDEAVAILRAWLDAGDAPSPAEEAKRRAAAQPWPQVRHAGL